MPARRLPATLLLAIASCSPPFEAAPAGADAQPMPSESGANSDAAMQPDEMVVGPPDGPGGDGSVAPPVTANLLLWLRADAGVTQTRGAVSNWADQSGHSSDAVQTNPTKQPRLGSSGSSRSAVVFDADDFMSLPAGFRDFSLGLSMFVVFYTDSTGNCLDVLDFSNGPEIDDVTIGRHDGRVHYEVAASALPGDEFPLGTPILASVVHQEDWPVRLRVNSAPITVNGFEPPWTVTRLSNVVGRSLYADCGSLEGGLFEALVYDRALDTDERLRVENYLQTRWDCCK